MKTKASQFLQKAGQSVHNASVALTSAVQEYSTLVNKSMGAEPFAVETDQLFETWKATARLAQEVSALDSRLRQVFEQSASSQVATELTAIPFVMPAASTATDVEVKEPVTVRGKPGPKPKPAPLKVTQKKGPVPMTELGKLSGNAEKVLAHLKTLLGTDEFVKVNQSLVAKGADIPQGSITASLSALKTHGLLKEGKKGSYRLTAKA